MILSRYKHDVFISHAVDDKLAIANELFQRLEEAGLRIWYSGKELRIGDSIEESIRRNLSLSRYAVVIFSKNYLVKHWTMKELYLLMGHEIAKRKVILPILLDVTVDDLKAKDIAIADKFAIPVEKGLDYIVEKILEEVRGVKRPKPKALRRRLVINRSVFLIAAAIALLLAVSYAVYAFYTDKPAPDQALISKTIERRVAEQVSKVEKELKTKMVKRNATAAMQQDIVRAFNEFEKLKTYYRNEYEFSNGYKELRFKKNVEKELSLDLDALTPYNSYGFAVAEMFLTSRYPDGLVDCISYTLINSQPVIPAIIGSKSRDNGDYEVTVRYEQNIRGVSATLIFPAQDFPKRYQVSLAGFLPSEKYIFHEDSGSWTWTALE